MSCRWTVLQFPEFCQMAFRDSFFREPPVRLFLHSSFDRGVIVGEKDRKKKNKPEVVEAGADPQWWSDTADYNGWTDHEPNNGFEPEATPFVTALSESAGTATRSRVDSIKESHTLLRQFSQKELKILMNLKRNTSPKAWTLREDLVVLTLSMSNREIADVLKERNKEAVKKRLQLLRSKGLNKRQMENFAAQQLSQ